jgi:hypothetical protein
MNISRDLSLIPGFVDLLKNGEVPEKYNKYYKSHKYNKNNTEYLLVKYDKQMLCHELYDTFGLLRSVIMFNSKVVCFAPQKSLSGDNFMIKYPTKTLNIVAEEFVEGTMINVFCHNGNWIIATRSKIGAEVSFFKSKSGKTFYDMFLDACKYNNFIYETLHPEYCYSFVLQHPENRIVTPFKHPQLYLVAVYQIQNEHIVIEKNMDEVKKYGLWNMTGIKFPVVYEFTNYSELIEKFASPNTPYDVMGIVVKNMETGERTKLRNPIYEEVRQLRGNQSKLQYQYLTLRQSGKLSDFLKYYPETKHEMSRFRDQVHMFTNNLHKNYISCYIKKENPLNSYPHQYKCHMYKLHEHFINNLRPNNLYITNTEVIKYVNNLHPQLLMYSLNYNLRKKMVDTIKANSDV